jgi:hypothetical protein
MLQYTSPDSYLNFEIYHTQAHYKRKTDGMHVIIAC